MPPCSSVQARSTPTRPRHTSLAPHCSDLFLGSTLTVAPRLLGCRLTSTVDGNKVSGLIVEVEAYLHRRDPASHSFRGPSARNASMFLEAGHCYVYLIYGVHYCVNVVTECAGLGAAVLIRALEPIEGVEVMQARRGQKDLHALCSGPGKVCQALGITPDLQGVDLRASDSPLRVEPPLPIPMKDVERSRRIGISVATERLWRFSIRGNPFVSRRA